MKPSDPLLLANGTLRCGMFPVDKVGISRHLATPRTILSQSSVRTLAFIEMKHSRPPDLKSSSNVSLTFAWITGPRKRTQLQQFVKKLK